MDMSRRQAELQAQVTGGARTEAAEFEVSEGGGTYAYESAPVIRRKKVKKGG